MVDFIEKYEAEINKHKAKALRYFGVGIALVIIAPVVLTQPAFISSLDFTNSGTIGSTIGGIAAPIVGIITAFLMYQAFLAQLEANKIQMGAHYSSLKIQGEQKMLDFLWKHFDNIQNAIFSNYYLKLKEETLDSYNSLNERKMYEVTTFISEEVNQIGMLFVKINGYKDGVIKKDDIVVLNSQLLVLLNRMFADNLQLISPDFVTKCGQDLSERVWDEIQALSEKITADLAKIRQKFEENYKDLHQPAC